MRYTKENFINKPIGNNHIDFFWRKEKWSNCELRIAPLINWNIDDIKLSDTWVCYEYISDKWILTSASWLDSFVCLSKKNKDIYIVDNHNHAFSCWWRSYLNQKINRWAHLVHVDQHSDYADPISVLWNIYKESIKNISLDKIDMYTNEVLTIASFIKPSLDCWICMSHEMILSEYSLLNYELSLLDKSSIIVDIDLDFWAPEMWIEYYYQTIKKMRQIINLPQVWCITIATSPTYIHQNRALEVLLDILD